MAERLEGTLEAELAPIHQILDHFPEVEVDAPFDLEAELEIDFDEGCPE